MGKTNFIGQKLDLRTGILLRYRFQETSGNAKDSSGNNYDGTVIGATQTTTGVELDGVNDEITNTAAGLLASLTSISEYTVFIRCSAPALTADEQAFSFGESNDNDAWSIAPYSSTGADGAKFWIDGDYIETAVGDAPADDSMHDFVFISTDATNHEMFVDAISEAINTDNKTTAANMEGVTVGRYTGNGEWYEGKVMELIVWDRALTDQQAKYLSTR